MEPGHVPACAAFASAAPDPWRREDLEQAIAGENHRCFAALQGGRPVGFACFLTVGDSADLQLIAVAPEHRRHGVAKALLGHALGQLQAQGVGQVLLEVRVSNRGALALYRGLGFVQLATRPAMYGRPQEDGLLMARPLADPDKTETDTKEANA